MIAHDDVTVALLATMRMNLILLETAIVPRLTPDQANRVKAGCRMLLGGVEDVLGLERTIPTHRERRLGRDQTTERSTPGT